MNRFSFKDLPCLAATLLLALTWAGVSEGKSYYLTVSGTSDGFTERSIGATEGCADFKIGDLVDVGLRNYRIWAGMSRLEPEDDDGLYGQPTIDAIKVDPNVINWKQWDHQFTRKDSYHFSPGGSCTTQVSLLDILSALKANGIAAVVTLRNVDDNGQPLWAGALNPPRTDADWNEWWEHVFATVYWVNVRNELDVHDWQVHNEPDGFKQGWGGTFQEYLLFARRTREAIQFVYDRYLPGKTSRLYAPVATGVNTWVEESLIQNDDVVDVVDWHNYSSSHYAGAVQVNEWIAEHDSDDKHEDTYLSEWGSYRSAYGFSNALSYAKILIEHSRDAAGYVTGSAIFPFYDWQTIKGIVHADGTKTPTYYALRMMTRGLQGAKTRYPVSHSISNTVDIQPIAAMASDGKTLYVEVINKTRSGHVITLDISAHVSSGSATLRHFADGVNDESIGTVNVSSGRITLELPALSIMQVITPPESPAPGSDLLHVSNIVMSVLKQGKSYQASATVSIANSNGNSVSGATVLGVFSGPTADKVSGITDNSGWITMNSSSTRQTGTWSFCVSGVVREGWSYDQTANMKTCDSISTPGASVLH